MRQSSQHNGIVAELFRAKRRNMLDFHEFRFCSVSQANANTSAIQRLQNSLTRNANDFRVIAAQCSAIIIN